MNDWHLSIKNAYINLINLGDQIRVISHYKQTHISDRDMLLAGGLLCSLLRKLIQVPNNQHIVNWKIISITIFPKQINKCLSYSSISTVLVKLCKSDTLHLLSTGLLWKSQYLFTTIKTHTIPCRKPQLNVICNWCNILVCIIFHYRIHANVHTWPIPVCPVC